MKNYNKNGWLNTAMGQVRCVSEKKAIRAELLAHIEDKEQYFLETGMDPRDAAKEAVAAMGDPVEVGKELDKAHPAVWGRLYTAAKVLIAVLCIMIGISVLFGALGDFGRNHPWKVVLYDPSVYGSENVIILEDTYKPIRQSGYTIDVIQAYWEPVVEYDTANGIQRDEDILSIDIKVFNPRPWAITPLFMDRLAVQGDEDTSLHELAVNMPSGDRVVGVLDNWYRNLKDYRYWGAWYFTVELADVDCGEEVTLYLPGNDEVTWTFQVGVSQ